MIEKDYTFDSFMLSRSNNISQLACKAAIDEPQNYSPVLLHGPTGCGKTHLLRASEAYAAALGKKTLYVTMSELISRVLTEEDLVPRLCEYQLILVDDASEIAGMDSTQTEAALLIHKLLSPAQTPFPVSRFLPRASRSIVNTAFSYLSALPTRL